MTMSEVEVDRITQQVFAARNSGLDAALVKVVIDEIEKATEAQAAKIARVESVCEVLAGLAVILEPHDPAAAKLIAGNASDLRRALDGPSTVTTRAIPAPPSPGAESECCASGSCEVCRPGRGGWGDR